LNELYDEIEQLIEDITGQIGMPFTLGAFSGMGWCYAPTPMSKDPYPNITIKQQKNAIHVYYAFWKFNEDEKKRFTSIFGQSAAGKSCIRIKKMTSERKEALAYIINRCKEI